EQLNRAKVNVLWSLKEGVNRAIIEGMLAGVPCVLREGFNYGYHYPHVNSQTGCYSSEKGLPDVLLRMIERYGDFSPREWVLNNMSCHKGTEVLGRVIKDTALSLGEVWTRDLAVKTSELNGQRYWDPADKERFADDYKFLREAVRGKALIQAT